MQPNDPTFDSQTLDISDNTACSLDNETILVLKFIKHTVHWEKRHLITKTSHLDQPHVLVDGLLLTREAFFQLLWEAGPAAVDGILAAVFWRSQHNLVERIFQRLPLQLSISHLVQHAAERLVVQQVSDVVDS